MKGIFVSDFGIDEHGVITYRINGEKDDLHHIINEAKELGVIFREEPIFEKAHKHFSVLLRFYVPEEIDHAEES
jgi:hypothetical protein